MSGVLATVGKVAGIVAVVAAPFNPGVAAVAALVSGAANAGAQLTAKRPPMMGSASNVTIGADQPRPWMMGDTYYGGARQLQKAYGSPINKVPNPLAAIVDVYSMGGPIAGIDGYYLDFSPVTFSGATSPGNPPREATGYFDDLLFVQSHWGASPQAVALSGPWGAIPTWGANAKISGGTHVLWSLKWDSKSGKFQSGVPQLGIRGRGALTYDPRLDGTYPGGIGNHRWADPRADRAGYDAARETFSYAPNPALYALRYALGVWERDETDADSDYILTFGIGAPIDALVVEDFVEWANVCDLNGWEISGVVFEPGDRWANLKRMCEAGGAEPVFKGGRLGINVRAARVSLGTIGMEALADGEPEIAGMQPWSDRINTVIPKFKSPAHKWEMQQTGSYAVADYIAEDGEPKRREVPFELVKEPVQSAQLAAYVLFDSREQGPNTIPVQPTLRGVFAGERWRLSDDLAEYLGVREPEILVKQRNFDPASMTGTLTFATDAPVKHALALAATATEPEPITLPAPEDYDGAAILPDNDLALRVINSYANSLTVAASGTTADVTISAHTRVYPDIAPVAVDGGTITGLDFETTYYLAYDDPDRAGGTVGYSAYATAEEAGPSVDHPGRHFVARITTPVEGAGDTGSGGGGPPWWKFEGEDGL